MAPSHTSPSVYHSPLSHRYTNTHSSITLFFLGFPPLLPLFSISCPSHICLYFSSFTSIFPFLPLLLSSQDSSQFLFLHSVDWRYSKNKDVKVCFSSEGEMRFPMFHPEGEEDRDIVTLLYQCVFTNSLMFPINSMLTTIHDSNGQWLNLKHRSLTHVIYSPMLAATRRSWSPVEKANCVECSEHSNM